MSGDSDSTRQSIISKMAAAGMRWMRIDVSWGSIENSGKGSRNASTITMLDRCVDLARQNGMRALVVVASTPSWANGGQSETVPPTNPNDFKDIAQWLADHFRGRVAAWQVYNEENNTTYFNGSVAQYVSVLKAGYAGFKAGDPSGLVVLGGIMWEDDAYVRSLYDAGAKDYFDVLATHGYHFPGDDPPETPDTGSAHPIAHLSHIPAVRSVMTQRGDSDAQIWLTEFGWSNHTNGHGEGDATWARGVDETTQADYAVRAVRYVRSNFPYVGTMVWYKTQSAPLSASADWQAIHWEGMGLLRSDLSARPVYDAFKQFLTGSG